MASEHRPVSERVAQGWEVLGYSVAYDGMGVAHCFLLGRQKRHITLKIRRKPFGGLWVEEIEL